ncbi:MAG: hypothetical protein JO147_04775, partial [Actinobacteria bacterium]|nr:hypothetical protein [Actinomycetota bacterium]
MAQRDGGEREVADVDGPTTRRHTEIRRTEVRAARIEVNEDQATGTRTPDQVPPSVVAPSSDAGPDPELSADTRAETAT